MKQDVYNTSKLTFHEKKLEALLKGEITSPICVRVKPTNKCNHRCFYCGYEEDSERSIMNRKSEIPKEKMTEILSDFKNMGVKALTYSGGGEPLIYPYIIEIMEKTLENNIELSIITNGQELKGRKADILTQAEWVRVSCGESNAETFTRTRKRPESWFYKLTKNIGNFAKIKNSNCELGINFVVQKENANQVYESVKYFKDLGVDHIKITPCWMPDFLEYHIYTKESVLEQIEKARQDFQEDDFKIYDTYEKDFFYCGVNKRTYEKCFHMQIVPVIGADCNVYFCHDKAYKPDGILGSIKEISFEELWFNDDTKKIFQTFNPKIECQHHCANDARNIMTMKLLNDLKNLEKYKPTSDKHKNFI